MRDQSTLEMSQQLLMLGNSQQINEASVDLPLTITNFPTSLQQSTLEDGQGSELSYEEVEEEEIPLEELEEILSQDEPLHSRREQILVEAVFFLQDKCSKMDMEYQELLEKWEQHEEQREQVERSQMSQDITAEIIEVLEKEIKQYREELTKYHENQVKQVMEFRQEVKELTSEVENMRREHSELVAVNQELQEEEEGLMDEIKQLEGQIQNLKNQKEFDKHPFGKRRIAVQDNLKVQLELLIEKLVSELELERGQKKRLAQQKYQMQAQITRLERQLGRLYKMQLSNFNHQRKSQPYETVSPGNRHKTHSPQSPPKTVRVSYRRQQTARMHPNCTLSLNQLVNESKPSLNTRVVLGVKVVDLYLRKISRNEFNPLQLEHILVSNYLPDKPHLSVVRKSERSGAQDQGDLEGTLWSLGLVLDQLIGQVDDRVGVEVSETIDGLCSGKKSEVGDVRELRVKLREMMRAGV